MANPLRVAPLLGLGLARAVTSRARGNAASAAETLRRQIRDRATLQPSADDGVPHRAGEISRLSREECMRLLRTRHIGRFAYVARADTPDVVPVNYTLDGKDRILVRSGPGPKLLAAQRHARVAFEVDQIDEPARQGWSVVVTGQAETATSKDNARMSQQIRPWAAGPRHHIIRITPYRVEGRRLN